MNELEEYNKFKRWIHKIAYQIWHKNRSKYDVDDIIQEATIGFIYGLRHYKYDNNKTQEENEYLKIAYIKRCVEGFAKNTPTLQQVHVPGNIHNLYMKYTKEVKENPDLAPKIFAEKHHLTKKQLTKLETALIMLKPSTYKSTSQLTAMETELIENIPSQDPTPEEQILFSEDINEQLSLIYPIFTLLRPQQQFILIHIYGLFNYEILTINEIAKQLDLTVANVAQNKCRAIELINHYLQTGEIKV